MTEMSATVTIISGRQHKRGRTSSTKAMTSLTTETQESELIVENKDASVAADNAIAMLKAIPLDFDLLESHMPFYQSALEDRLEYEFTFKDYNCVIWTTDDTNAPNDIENISFEYDMVTLRHDGGDL